MRFLTTFGILCTFAAASLGQPIDDEALFGKIETLGGQMHDAGRTVALEKLKAQLAAPRPAIITTPPAGSERLTPPAVYRQRRAGVVAIGGLFKCGECDAYHSSIASGFAVDTTGAIATCYHVIADSDDLSLVAVTLDGRVFPITEVIAADELNDLAVVRAPGLDVTPLPINGDAEVGADVAVISHPDARLWSLTRGSITRHSVLHTELGSTHVLEISADFAGGSSGGPVFDDRGNVVAIVSSTTTAYSDALEESPEAEPASRGDKKPPVDEPPTEPYLAGPQVQMIFKECIPARKLLDMLAPVDQQR